MASKCGHQRNNVVLSPKGVSTETMNKTPNEGKKPKLRKVEQIVNIQGSVLVSPCR